MHQVLTGLQSAAIITVGTGATVLLAYTVMCVLGASAWLTLLMAFGDVTLVNFGIYLQIAATGLVVSAALMAPTNMRLSAATVRFRFIRTTWPAPTICATRRTLWVFSR